MKVKIDESTCTGCGLCADNCPEVFELGDSVAKVIADPVPAEKEECAKEAAENCPVDAISIE
ncbi:MAG: ferredoxin [Candidatus Omnitrophica bacterium]|nr:ferredoxin [Candidatus Omnitrophota bacterium]MCM8821604.1 ferredoxin [Candidatus Omnitrophota bacterium]MCM8824743.1 ferredoxin [Candidatus Omnitrophota bacterium]MCM8828432.1 ferredoxin [Candidatus Omnitrophota bacterium]